MEKAFSLSVSRAHIMREERGHLNNVITSLRFIKGFYSDYAGLSHAGCAQEDDFDAI